MSSPLDSLTQVLADHVHAFTQGASSMAGNAMDVAKNVPQAAMQLGSNVLQHPLKSALSVGTGALDAGPGLINQLGNVGAGILNHTPLKPFNAQSFQGPNMPLAGHLINQELGNTSDAQTALQTGTQMVGEGALLNAGMNQLGAAQWPRTALDNAKGYMQNQQPGLSLQDVSRLSPEDQAYINSLRSKSITPVSSPEAISIKAPPAQGALEDNISPQDRQWLDSLRGNPQKPVPPPESAPSNEPLIQGVKTNPEIVSYSDQTKNLVRASGNVKDMAGLGQNQFGNNAILQLIRNGKPDLAKALNGIDWNVGNTGNFLTDVVYKTVDAVGEDAAKADPDIMNHLKYAYELAREAFGEDAVKGTPSWLSGYMPKNFIYAK